MAYTFPLFYQILDFIGTFAFAISGVRLAAAKHFDLFGAFVVGFVTAIGGGTLRDILLDSTPVWMANPIYLIITGLALLWAILFRKYLVRQNITWMFFDAVGLALFTVTGQAKAILVGFPVWVGLIMGTITGSAGGVFRDILLNEEPLIFRRDIYATACVVGCLVYAGLDALGVPSDYASVFCAVTVLVTRILSVKYNISLPQLKSEE